MFARSSSREKINSAFASCLFLYLKSRPLSSSWWFMNRADLYFLWFYSIFRGKAKPRPNDHNISTQHIATLLGATCCVRLATLLRRVVTCWLKFESGQVFHTTFVDVAWCCSRLARFVQQCCAQACTLVRFSTRNMAPHVATGWPKACNMLRPTMLICCV